MSTRSQAEVISGMRELTMRKLVSIGVSLSDAEQAIADCVADVYERRPSVLKEPRSRLYPYFLVAARNSIISAKRRGQVARRYREVQIRAQSLGIETARYAELMLLLVEWRAATGLSDLERRLRRVFLECRTPSAFGREAGLDWRIATRKYASLRESFCEHLGIEESLFLTYTCGPRRKRAA